MSTLDLLVIWLLPAAATLLLLVTYRSVSPVGWPARLSSAWWVPIFLLTRVLYAVLLFVVLEKWFLSDAYAWKGGTAGIFEGGVPGRDFENLYGHLYYYLLGLFRLLTPGRHWVGTLFPMMIGDLLTIGLSARIARGLRGVAWGRWVGVYLLLSPYFWHQLVVRGQEESLFVGFLVASAWLLLSGRAAWGGLVLGLGFCTNKLTYGPYALAMLVACSAARPVALRAWVASGMVVAVVYAFFLALGAPLWPAANLSEHIRNFGLGISLPDTAARILPSFPVGASLVFFAAATAAAAVAIPLRLRERPLPLRLLASMVGVHAASMLSMPFCVSPYLAQGVPFVLLLLVALPESARGRTLALLGLTVLGGLCTLHWTKSRAFSIPMKPCSIAFSLLLLWMVLRIPRGGVEAAGTGVAQVTSGGE